MGRYANHGQEVLYRDGKLVGFNAGFGFYCEHENGYAGIEQQKKDKIFGKKDKNSEHPFYLDMIKNPDSINKIEFEDGSVWILNDPYKYRRIMQLPEKERYDLIQDYTYNDDRKRYEDFAKKIGLNEKTPEITALWSGGYNGFGGNFDLISTNKEGGDILKTLFEEMKKSNVAISSDYSFMFRERGLSFVLLDQLTNEDLLNKQLVDHSNEMAKKFQEEYREYLAKEGLDESVVIGKGGQYPVEFWNVQIRDLNTNSKRRNNS